MNERLSYSGKHRMNGHKRKASVVLYENCLHFCPHTKGGEADIYIFRHQFLKLK